MVRAMGLGGNTQCAAAWAYAFELGKDSSSHQVAELLGKLSKELRSTEAALIGLDVPPHLYSYALDALKPMMEVHNLAQPWSNISAGGAENHLVALRWAAYVLPEEANQIDTEDLNELKQLLAEFESALKDAILPPGLHAYLSDQLNSMKDAIAAAAVSGAADIKAAVRKAVADVHFNGEALRAEASEVDSVAVKDVQSKFRSLFKKGAEVAGDIDKFGKGIKLVSEGVDWLMLQFDKAPLS